MNNKEHFLKIIAKHVVNIAIAIVITVAVIFFIDYLGLVSYYYFSKNSYTEFSETPDLYEGYVPQGMCYIENNNVVLQTSYSENAPSKLYVFDYDRKELTCKFILKDSTGKEIYNHVGGITSNGDKIWICGDSNMFIYSLSDVLSSSENDLKSIKEISIPSKGDFCFYQYTKISNNPNESHYYNILWIGSFYVNLNPFKKSSSVLYGYNLAKSDGISNLDNPDYTVAIPDKVQDLYIDKNNNFYFSRSYSGFLTSTIDVHENLLNSKTEEFLVNAKRVQYHDYRNTRRLYTYTLPPMAEGIFIKNNKLHVIFESAAQKYLYAMPKINKILLFNAKEME